MYFERIKDSREESDLKQREVAEILGITRENYSAIENGRISFSLIKLSELADYYNLSIDYLLGLTNEKRYSLKPKEIDLCAIGKNLKKARRLLHLTQENFASDLKIKQPSYVAYEKNKTIISVDKLYILARKYNLSFDKLLGKYLDTSKED